MVLRTTTKDENVPRPRTLIMVAARDKPRRQHHGQEKSNGKIIDAPSFFGANPAEVRQGPRKGLRALLGEDDRGIELIR